MFDWFDKHKKRERTRRERAGQQAVVEITGLLSRGAARVQTQGCPAEEVVTFRAWRVDDGPLEAGELRLVQEIVGDDPPFGSLWGMPPETVVTMKARLFRADDGAFGIVAGPARVVDPDPVLTEAIQHRRSPPTFDDPHLGKLTADDLMGWVGEADWLGGKCRVSVDHLDELPVAHALWSDQKRWMTEAINIAVTKLLELKNDTWLGEDEAPVSADAFGRRLKLESVTIGRKGAFELWLDDGDLFWGHAIMIRGSLSHGLTDADLAG